MQITINRPFDAHVHLRKKDLLRDLVKQYDIFDYIVVMGNLTPPIIRGMDAQTYQKEIMDLDPKFTPVMSIMLTADTTPQIILDAFKAGVRVLKFIPCGTSTGSSNGIRLVDLPAYYHILKLAEDIGMIFSGHWELIENPRTGNMIRMLDREKHAIPFLEDVIKKFPKLKIIVEHVSTKKMVELVKSAPANVAATITAHHVLIGYSDVFDQKERITNPYLFCKPCVKTIPDQIAVMEAMIGGNPKFFFGSDSAPHPKWDKRGKNPAAGIYTSGFVAASLLCQIFEDCKFLNRLDNFISRSGKNFYNIPQTTKTVTMIKEKWTIPIEICGVVQFMGGRTLDWRVKAIGI